MSSYGPSVQSVPSRLTDDPPGTDASRLALPALRPKILVIEDDVSLSRALALRLDSRGYDAILAHDGVVGLEAVDAEPDLVVLDLGLPRIRGLTVARRILESLETWYMPVIVITGDRSNNVSVYLRELGATAVVGKPFESDKLIDLIEDTLRSES